MARSPYDVLLERILLGVYPPGANLVEHEIAQELGVSRTPVREALLRLKLEGLVRIIPRGGIFVAEASVLMIREVTETRLVLEEYLAQLVVERCTDEWVREFKKWLHELEPKWSVLSDREWMLKDDEFHALLDEAAINSVLSRHLRILRQQAVLFWGQSKTRPQSLSRIVEDFKAASKAIQKRDADLLASALKTHCLDHVERIQQFMKPAPKTVVKNIRR